jgi:hypothetical protein
VETVTQPKAGKKLIRFNQCNCGRKEFCRMFGQDPSCDEVVPDYPDKHRNEETTTDFHGRRWVKHSTGTEFQEDHIR